MRLTDPIPTEPYAAHLMLNPKKCFVEVDQEQFDLSEIQDHFNLDRYARFFQVSVDRLGFHTGRNSSFTHKQVLINYFEILYAYLNGHFSAYDPPGDDIKQAIIAKVSEGIQQCSPGFLNRVQSIISGIKLPKQLIDLLANYRKQIVEKVCNNVQEVHAHNRYFRIANQLGLSIPYRAERDVYRGAHSDRDIRFKLSNAFNQHYTPSKIVSELFLSIFNGYEYCGDKTNASEGYKNPVYSGITEYLQEFFDDKTLCYDTVFRMNEDWKFCDINWLWVSDRLIKLLDDRGCFYNTNPGFWHRTGRLLGLFKSVANYSPTALTNQYEIRKLSKRLTVHFCPHDPDNSRIEYTTVLRDAAQDSDDEDEKSKETIYTYSAFYGARFNDTLPILRIMEQDDIQLLIDLFIGNPYEKPETLPFLLSSLDPESQQKLHADFYSCLLTHVVIANDPNSLKSALKAIIQFAHLHCADLGFLENLSKKLDSKTLDFLLRQIEQNDALELDQLTLLSMYQDRHAPISKKEACWPHLVKATKTQTEFDVLWRLLDIKDQKRLIEDTPLTLSLTCLLSIYDSLNSDSLSFGKEYEERNLLKTLLDKLAASITCPEDFATCLIRLRRHSERTTLIGQSSYTLQDFAEHPAEFQRMVTHLSSTDQVDTVFISLKKHRSRRYQRSYGEQIATLCAGLSTLESDYSARLFEHITAHIREFPSHFNNIYDRLTTDLQQQLMTHVKSNIQNYIELLGFPTGQLVASIRSPEEFVTCLTQLGQPTAQDRLIHLTGYSLNYFSEHPSVFQRLAAHLSAEQLDELIITLNGHCARHASFNLEYMATLCARLSELGSSYTARLFEYLTEATQASPSAFNRIFPQLTTELQQQLLDQMGPDLDYYIHFNGFASSLSDHLTTEQLAALFSQTIDQPANVLRYLRQTDFKNTSSLGALASTLRKTQTFYADQADLAARYRQFCPSDPAQSDLAQHRQEIGALFLNYLHPRGTKLFSGHWNRHHDQQARAIVEALSTDRITSIAALQELLDEQYASALMQRKETARAFLAGSFARRISYACQRLAGIHAPAPQKTWSHFPPFALVYNLVNLVVSTLVLAVKTLAFLFVSAYRNLSKSFSPFRASGFYDSSLFSNQAVRRFWGHHTGDNTHYHRFVFRLFNALQALIETAFNLVTLPTRAVSTLIAGRSNPLAQLEKAQARCELNKEIQHYLDAQQSETDSDVAPVSKHVKYVQRVMMRYHLPLRPLTPTGEHFVRAYYQLSAPVA